MDFKATGWFERNYKWIVAVMVISISICSICYYFSLTDKSDTFIAASLYALFLFVAGIYMNYVSNKITDQLQDRIEIYLNLQRVHSFFEVFIENETTEYYEGIKRKIMLFQDFTNRTKKTENDGTSSYIKELNSKEKENGGTPLYIKELGIKFNSKELEVEDSFLELYSSLTKSVATIIEDYTNKKHISISCRNVVIDNLDSFRPELWCKKNLIDYKTDGRKMVNHIYVKLNDLNEEYSKLDLLGTKISQLYSNYSHMTKINIRQIENMYGRKLQHIIFQQREIRESFDYLFKALKDMENRIELQIEEHDTKIESYVECLEQISTSIESLCSDVDEIKDMVSGFNDYS